MPAHEIEGPVHRIPARDMQAHARAYAMLAYDLLAPLLQFSPTERADFLMHAKGRAQGDPTDWAACDQHFVMWERYKRNYPPEG